MADRNGWTLWSAQEPPHNNDNLIVVKDKYGDYKVLHFTDYGADWFWGERPGQLGFDTNEIVSWAAVPYPAIVEYEAKAFSNLKKLQEAANGAG